MLDFKKVFRILSAKLKSKFREAREDLFPLAISPILILALYLGFRDLGSTAFLKLKSVLLPQFILTDLLFWIFLLALLFFVISLPDLVNVLFAFEADDRYLRALPLRPAERYGAMLARRLARNLGPGLLVGTLIYWLRLGILRLPAGLVPSMSAGLVFTFALTPFEILAAQSLAKLKCLSWNRFLLAIGSVVVISFTLHISNHDHLNIFLIPFLAVHEFALLNAEVTSRPYFKNLSIGVLTSLTVAGLGFLTFVAWPASELRSSELFTRRPTMLNWLLGIAMLRRFFDGKVLALLKRDLILTSRIFHRGIILNFAAALFWLAVMVYSARRFHIAAGSELFLLSTSTCVMGAFSIALIAAWLQRYQLRFVWIEKSSRLDPYSLWFSKVLLANALSLLFMPLLTTLTVSVFTKPPLGELVIIFVVCLLFTAAVASATGSLIYEFESHPALALCFCFMASVPISIVLLATYWWLMFFVFPVGMHYLKDRGIARIRIILRYAIQTVDYRH